MSKNNLSAFKRPAAKSVLQTAAQASPSAPPKKIGKPKKREDERLSKRAQVMFTDAEFDRLTKNRGAVPLSTYLRIKLQEIGEI
jgi:hypothetical protein